MANNKNHVKPTAEELEANIQAAIEEAESVQKEEPEPTPEEIHEPEKEAVELETTPETEEAEPSKPEPEPQELKKKLSASARENQKIYAKNRVITRALVEADEVPEPTEEEMASRYKDWDVMSDIEKHLARETEISRQWRKIISDAKEQSAKIEKWNDSVNEFVESPQTLIDHPDLEGKTEEFREFATQEANNSVPMNILVSAFLHEQSTGRKPNKGRMFETGSGGPNSKPQPVSDKISLDEARKLRETNYNKYKEYLVAGRIDTDL